MSEKSFEFQSWTVYREAIDFCRVAQKVCSTLPKEGSRSISDQLRRASHSIPLNIAEGSSRFSRNDKVNFLRIARGSVFECVAILDILDSMNQIQKSELSKIQRHLNELGKMLSGFINHIEANNPNVTGNLAR